jgi:hypothetical protein
MPEKPPEYISKKDDKKGELIEVDFRKKEITSRSRDAEGPELKPEEEQKIIMDTEKYKADFFRWLDGHILKMKFKAEEINGLLTSGGESRVFQYANYLHIKNDPTGILKDPKADFLGNFSPEDRELFGKIETHQMLFSQYLKEFFRMKSDWECAMKNLLAEIQERKRGEQLAKKLQSYLSDLKIYYGVLENLEESQVIKKMEEFVEKNKKMTAN